MPIFGADIFNKLSGGPSKMKDGSIIKEPTDFYVTVDEMSVVSDTDSRIIYERLMKKYKLENTLVFTAGGANLITGIAVALTEVAVILGFVLPKMHWLKTSSDTFAIVLLMLAAMTVPAAAVYFFMNHFKCKSELRLAIEAGSYEVYNCKIENKTTRVVRSRHGSTTYYYLTLSGGMVEVSRVTYFASGIGGMLRCVIVSGESHRYLLLIDN